MQNNQIPDSLPDDIEQPKKPLSEEEFVKEIRLYEAQRKELLEKAQNLVLEGKRSGEYTEAYIQTLLEQQESEDKELAAMQTKWEALLKEEEKLKERWNDLGKTADGVFDFAQTAQKVVREMNPRMEGHFQRIDKTITKMEESYNRGKEGLQELRKNNDRLKQMAEEGNKQLDEQAKTIDSMSKEIAEMKRYANEEIARVDEELRQLEIQRKQREAEQTKRDAELPMPVRMLVKAKRKFRRFLSRLRS